MLLEAVSPEPAFGTSTLLTADQLSNHGNTAVATKEKRKKHKLKHEKKSY